jgi:hypothetical protein
MRLRTFLQAASKIDNRPGTSPVSLGFPDFLGTLSLNPRREVRDEVREMK